MASSRDWRADGAALARQSATVPTVESPDDLLASYLSRSASSAVQQRFEAGIRAAQEADGISAATAAGALLIEALLLG